MRSQNKPLAEQKIHTLKMNHSCKRLKAIDQQIHTTIDSINSTDLNELKAHHKD